jgi:tetratricopeptide (TPR) repeat protein
VYLSPDGDPLWLLPGADASQQAQQQAAEAAATAQRLLDDIPPERRSPRHEILCAYVQMSPLHNGGGDSRRAAASADAAIARLASILELDPDNCEALLALATAFVLRKEAAKARAQLKRLLKQPFNSAIPETFISGWLCLADLFVESVKGDQAADALQRALDLDASCGRAHELLGNIADAEKRWADAVQYFRKAFELAFEKNAPVGYKLASSLLRSGNTVESISVANKVLAVFPGYAIGDLKTKARLAIRP